MNIWVKLKLKLKKNLQTNKYRKALNIILKNVTAYEEKIIVKNEVLVNRLVSNVPAVFANLTSLLKIFSEENIKSIDRRLKNISK